MKIIAVVSAVWRRLSAMAPGPSVPRRAAPSTSMASTPTAAPSVGVNTPP